VRLAQLFEEPEVREVLEAAQIKAHEKLNGLTPRQRQIAVLMAEGHQNKIIAHPLGLSARTVENHRLEIMEKTGVKSFASLVKLVVLAG
jgi:two-component system response regulator FixJ